jgi:hypothetical protein
MPRIGFVVSAGFQIMDFAAVSVLEFASLSVQEGTGALLGRDSG